LRFVLVFKEKTVQQHLMMQQLLFYNLFGFNNFAHNIVVKLLPVKSLPDLEIIQLRLKDPHLMRKSQEDLAQALPSCLVENITLNHPSFDRLLLSMLHSDTVNLLDMKKYIIELQQKINQTIVTKI